MGAHAVLYHRKPHEDALRSWAKKLMQSKAFKLVAVALANNIARILEKSPPRDKFEAASTVCLTFT